MTNSQSYLPPWMRGFMIFWRITLLISLGFGIRDALQNDPGLLSNWRGLGLLLLIASFLLCYELYERTPVRRGTSWPMPYSQVLIYLIVQLPLSILLMRYTPGFIGPLFSLLGQVFSSLPMRKWAIPIGAILVVASVPMGLADWLVDGNWDDLLPFAFFAATWISLAVFMSMLFHERHQREELIAKLHKAKEDLEQYALQAEELAGLRERSRLAREMHDSLGHALVVVNVKLEAAQRLYAIDPLRGDAELEQTRLLVREAMAELRRSLADLRAELPQHHNLPVALQQIADEIRARTRLEITYATPQLPQLPPETSEALWRVAREALNNVERHAAAASATMSIERSNGSLVLRVVDDGSGVAPADLARPGHYGITGMRERVAALGGTLRVVAQPGGGTMVEAVVPAQ